MQSPRYLRATSPGAGPVDLARGPDGNSRSELGRLEWILVAATVLLSPVNYLRLEAMFVTAADVVAVAALLTMAARRAVPINFFGPATGIWLLSFIAFVGGLSLSSVVRGDPAALPTILAQYSFSLLVLPLILAGRSYDQTLLLLKLFVASIVFVMVFGIYVVHFVDNPDPHLVSSSGRLRSLVERANETAALGAMAMTLVLGLNFLGGLRVLWVVLALPILFYGVLLTGSVTGLLTSGLGMALVVFACGSRRQILLLAILVGVAVSVATTAGEALLPEIFRQRVFEPLSQADIASAGTFADRVALIREALGVSRDTLVLGLGAQQYSGVSAFQAPVHNVFLLALVEGGLLSFFGVLGLFLTGVFLAWSAATRAGGRAIGAITLVVLIVFIFVFSTVPTFYARFWHVPLLLALSLSASQTGPTRATGERYPNRALRIRKRG